MFRRTLTWAMATMLIATVLSLGTASGAQAAPQPWGSTSAVNQKIKKGCSRYAFSYVVDPPSTENWAAEVFLTDPNGVGVANKGYLSGGNALRGRDSFRLCEATIKPGRYLIRMRVTWAVGYDKREGFVKNTRFRLTRR